MIPTITTPTLNLLITIGITRLKNLSLLITNWRGGIADYAKEICVDVLKTLHNADLAFSQGHIPKTRRY
jgi:hypothetical protein